MQRIRLVLASLILLAGCSAGKDMGAAKQEVVQFHRQLDSGRFAEISAAAGPDIRNGTGEAQFTALLGAIHARLGPVKASSSRGFKVNYGTGGNVVELTYQTRFERGDGAESFVYRMENGKPRLTGYHIVSDALKR